MTDWLHNLPPGVTLRDIDPERVDEDAALEREERIAEANERDP